MIEFDSDVVAETHALYLGTLGPIDFADGFTALISETVDKHRILDNPPPLLRPYVDAYIDLHRLLEEIRFEVALAWLLIEDRRVKVERGELARPALPRLIPMEALALPQRYMREPPAPTGCSPILMPGSAATAFSATGSPPSFSTARSFAQSPSATA